MKTVADMKGAEWGREIRLATRPVLVHFYTSWCGRSHQLQGALEALAGELKNDLQVARVNLDHCPELAWRYGIQTVPTWVLFDNGAPIARLDPRMPPLHRKAQLQGLLADYAGQSNG